MVSHRSRKPERQTWAERLFIAVTPTGLSYCDRSRTKDGDYLCVARLPYRTLAIEWQVGRTRVDGRLALEPQLYQLIIEDAGRMGARRGEHFPISQSGQTVLLGA